MNIETIRNRCRECGDCWEWISSATRDHHKRYPQVKIGPGAPKLVRRVAWELVRGPIKSGLSISPDCGNPYCVNPAHMACLTESQKSKRAAKRGTLMTAAKAKAISDTRRKSAKISVEIAQIIKVSDESGPALAERYGVDRTLVSKIRRGQIWKDYSNPFAGLLR